MVIKSNVSTSGQVSPTVLTSVACTTVLAKSSGVYRSPNSSSRVKSSAVGGYHTDTSGAASNRTAARSNAVQAAR